MKKDFYLLALIAALAGCNKSPEDSVKVQEPVVASPASVPASPPAPPPAPSISYQLANVAENSIAGIFTITTSESGNAINYQSRAGVVNILESVFDDLEGLVYVSVEKAYSFGDKYVIIISTGEGGRSCPASTYAFAFDLKTESVIGKKEIDGCSEGVEILADGNKLLVKKDGETSTFYNAEIK